MSAVACSFYIRVIKILYYFMTTTLAERVVNFIIKDAIIKGASDIHIEPSEEDILVRFRIDGEMSEYSRVPIHVLPALVSRVKVMGALDIAESRIPQDGSVKLKYKTSVCELRISILPTINGENIVIY